MTAGPRARRRPDSDPAAVVGREAAQVPFRAGVVRRCRDWAGLWQAPGSFAVRHDR